MLIIWKFIISRKKGVIMTIFPVWISSLFTSQSPNLYQQKIAALKAAIPSGGGSKVSVLISGASISGLIRAIQARLSGSPTTVIEKRSEDAPGRENTVSLDDEAVDVLKQYAVYDYLIENQLINVEKPGSLVVRIKDLEIAMMAVLKEISPETAIQYDSQIIEIIERVAQTAIVAIRNKDGETTRVAPHLLVIAEGARSSTNELLGNSRIQVLPKVPVVAAIFKSREWSCSAIPGMIGDIFTHLYYTLLFLFKMTFGGENIFNSERRIRGAIILPTPGQNYVGFTLDKEGSEELKQLAEQYRKTNDRKIKSELDASLNYWSHLSFAFANALAIFAKVTGNDMEQFNMACWKPLDLESTSVIEIGADRAERCSGTVGMTAYLTAGDALHTVDPVTGLGASTAIKSAVLFKNILEKSDQGRLHPLSLVDYNVGSELHIRNIHKRSVAVRSLYRPDTVLV